MDNFLKIVPGISWKNYIENGDTYKALGIGDPSYTYTLYEAPEDAKPDIDYPSGKLHIKEACFAEYKDDWDEHKFDCIVLGNFETDWERHDIYPESYSAGTVINTDSRVAYALYALDPNIVVEDAIWWAVKPDDIMREGLVYKWYPVAVDLTYIQMA